ncbi:MAG: hypothetical protein WC781_01180 [Candidatus Pacearchaeota archaeon]|jgi:hypothetical protein
MEYINNLKINFSIEEFNKSVEKSKREQEDYFREFAIKSYNDSCERISKSIIELPEIQKKHHLREKYFQHLGHEDILEKKLTKKIVSGKIISDSDFPMQYSSLERESLIDFNYHRNIAPLMNIDHLRNGCGFF